MYGHLTSTQPKPQHSHDTKPSGDASSSGCLLEIINPVVVSSKLVCWTEICCRYSLRAVFSFLIPYVGCFVLKTTFCGYHTHYCQWWLLLVLPTALNFEAVILPVLCLNYVVFWYCSRYCSLVTASIIFICSSDKDIFKVLEALKTSYDFPTISEQYLDYW